MKFLVIVTTSHLSGLNSINQFASHCCIVSRSFCSVFASHASQLIVRYNKQSSANSLAFDEVFLVISLMQIRKRSGSNTVPWGTPDVTSDLEECFPSSTTSCFRFARKSLIQLYRFPRTPYIIDELV